VRQNTSWRVRRPIKKNKLFFFPLMKPASPGADSFGKKVPTQSGATLRQQRRWRVTGYMAQYANAYPLPDGNPTTVCTTFHQLSGGLHPSFPGKSTLDALQRAPGLHYFYEDDRVWPLFPRPSKSPGQQCEPAGAHQHPTSVYRRRTIVPAARPRMTSVQLHSHDAVKEASLLNYSGSLKTIFPSDSHSHREYLDNQIESHGFNDLSPIASPLRRPKRITVTLRSTSSRPSVGSKDPTGSDLEPISGSSIRPSTR